MLERCVDNNVHTHKDHNNITEQLERLYVHYYILTAKFKFNGLKIGRNLSLRYQKLESQLNQRFWFSLI
jgi:hypothetical protein